MSYKFPHRHLIDTDTLSRADIEALLDLAQKYAKQNRSAKKKIDKLRGKTCAALFFENSTRTRISFEIAAKRLSADFVSPPMSTSSVAKGETMLDTALAVDAMQVDAIVVRHTDDEAALKIAEFSGAHIINAGSGKRSHPTQALLDALTIRSHKKSLEGLTVAICGDLARSRVARSNIHLLQKFGAKMRVISPSYFLSDDYKHLNVEIFDDLEAGIHNADAVIMLRIQHEREGLGFDFASKAEEYKSRYRLTSEKLRAARPDALVLHPGPVNRGVEVTDEIADDPAHSVIREQIEMGVAVRMAVLDLLLAQ